MQDQHRLAHDHPPSAMQIDPDELFSVILAHQGRLPVVIDVNTPSIRRERHEERRPPFIASTRVACGMLPEVVS